MKLYQYTRLKQDGTKEKLEPRTKMTLQELQSEVNGYIEIVHKDYYEDGMNKRSTIYVNEEGRFNSDNTINPHFKDLGEPYNIVGNALQEEVYKETK